MRLSLFWRLGLTYLALLLAVLVAVDLYVARTLRRDYMRAGYEQLEALGGVARALPPQLDDLAMLRDWVESMGHSGAHVDVIGADGRVLADSAHDPETMEDPAAQSEVRQALADGEGRAVRHSATLGHDLVYWALRYQQGDRGPVVLRFALPLGHMDEVLAEFRSRLWAASLLILLVVGGAAFVFSRALSARIGR
ncbi:MAG TPA: hypothetical protein VHM88_26310, partial [Candidatus Acidoferrales bacterium]|nr:hypothetical protein [Candidatus Acidoferrales bacterium]